MTTREQQIPYSSELVRKSIHLASLLIPIIYLQLEHWTGIAVLTGMTAVSISIDALMHFHGASRRVLLNIVGPLLRTHEIREDKFYLTGASWVLIAATSSFLLFPTVIGVTAFTVLIVSDTFAALIGRRYGVRRFLDKSIVGTFTFIATGFVVVLTYAWIFSLPPMYIVCGAVACIVGGVAEAMSTRLKLDDNFSIPFSFSLTMLLIGVLVEGWSTSSFINLLP